MSLSDVKLTLVEGTEDLLDFRSWLGQSREFLAYDIETTGVNLGKDRIRLIQIGDREHGWAFPVEGSVSWFGAVTEALNSYRDSPILAHNSIFDSAFMKREGVDVPQHLAGDTMVMAQLIMSNLPVGLKPVASRLIDRKAVAGESVLKEGMKKQKWDWGTVPLEFPPYWQYGALDPVLTCRIAEKLWPKVKERYERSFSIEMAAIHVLRDAEIAGMPVDTDYCQKTSLELEAEMSSIAPQLPCNPNAPAQVIKFLQSKGAMLTKRTEKGKLAVDDEVLTYWEGKIPECAQIRRYRECSKLKSSYFDNILESQTDGMVHPSIRVLGAQKTGRMSITEPALQTLPKSTIGRNAFVSPEGETLIAADFSGIELRLLADAAGEKNMLDRFSEGTDMHSWTAQQIFQTDSPSKEQRHTAKTVGYAKIYGAGITKFAVSAGLTEEEAKSFLDSYDRLFPSVAKFQQDEANKVQESRPNDKQWGETHTSFGRRLFVPKEEAHTKSVNYRIQGTAGEVLKEKIVELSNAGLRDYIRLPIHDEVVFSVPDEEVDYAVETIQEVMPDRHNFNLELPVEVETTKRWGDLYEK